MLPCLPPQVTEYFTSFDYMPVMSIKDRGTTGPATVIIQVRLKGCEEKHSSTMAHHPVVKPPAAASHESVTIL